MLISSQAVSHHSVLNEGRLYGYFNVYTLQVKQHPADIVSYLVAAKVGDNINDAAASFVYLRRQEVIKEKGLVPPGPPYNEAYQSKQLVPFCYRHLFPNGSCYLPDYTALSFSATSATSIPRK